jgi:3-dehydroquinate dehydratase I
VTPWNKICVSVAEPTAALCREALAGLSFAEIRIDAMQASADDVRELFAGHPSLIATCRPGRYDDEERRALLVAAVSGGAAFVDLELDAPDALFAPVIRTARRKGCWVIVSHHDLLQTPCAQELTDLVDRCFGRGADITKIACMANSCADAARLLGLLDSQRRLVVVAMGKLGPITRLAAPLLGAPFTFASRSAGQPTALGQVDHETLERLMRELLRD